MAIYSGFFPLKMVMFHSYVSLPEGNMILEMEVSWNGGSQNCPSIIMVENGKLMILGCFGIRQLRDLIPSSWAPMGSHWVWFIDVLFPGWSITLINNLVRCRPNLSPSFVEVDTLTRQLRTARQMDPNGTLVCRIVSKHYLRMTQDTMATRWFLPLPSKTWVSCNCSQHNTLAQDCSKPF